jgi:hypothetical protein
MADEQNPKSGGNPLTEVAKTIGSTLGGAANRAGEMWRDIVPTAITGKLSGGAEAPKTTGAKAKSRSKAKKVAVTKSSKRGKPPAAQKTAKKKSARRAVAKKKSVRKPGRRNKSSRSKTR